MEDDYIDREFIETLNNQQLYYYFEQLVYEYNSLVKYCKGLKSKYFTIRQVNIADTFMWEDYHQRLEKYHQEDFEFALQIEKKNQQLEYVSTKFRRKIEHGRTNDTKHH